MAVRETGPRMIVSPRDALSPRALPSLSLLLAVGAHAKECGKRTEKRLSLEDHDPDENGRDREDSSSDASYDKVARFCDEKHRDQAQK